MLSKLLLKSQLIGKNESFLAVMHPHNEEITGTTRDLVDVREEVRYRYASSSLPH